MSTRPKTVLRYIFQVVVVRYKQGHLIYLRVVHIALPTPGRPRSISTLDGSWRVAYVGLDVL